MTPIEKLIELVKRDSKVVITVRVAKPEEAFEAGVETLILEVQGKLSGKRIKIDPALWREMVGMFEHDVTLACEMITRGVEAPL